MGNKAAKGSRAQNICAKGKPVSAPCKFFGFASKTCFVITHICLHISFLLFHNKKYPAIRRGIFYK